MIETVLLIEDDSATRYINKRIINKHGKFNTIVAFPGGNKALEYLKSLDIGYDEKPQLIFLDLNMPSMNGWQFINEYARLDKDIIEQIKLIILTTSNDPHDINRSKKIAEVHDYINKPLTFPILDKVLETHFSIV